MTHYVADDAYVSRSLDLELLCHVELFSGQERLLPVRLHYLRRIPGFVLVIWFQHCLVVSLLVAQLYALGLENVIPGKNRTFQILLIPGSSGQEYLS